MTKKHKDLQESNEDKRAAVGFSTQLSIQLMAASLAFIAILAGIASYVVQNQSVKIWFWLVWGLSYSCFIASMFFGGKGIHAVKKGGEKGEWATKKKGQINWFNWQSLVVLGGIILVPFLVLTSSLQKDVPIDSQIRHLRQQDSLILKQLEEMKQSINDHGHFAHDSVQRDSIAKGH